MPVEPEMPVEPADLSGYRVLVTRAVGQAASTIDALARRGAHAVLMPTIEIRPVADLGPLKRALAGPAGWLLVTSVNAVEALERAIAEAPSIADAAARWRVGAVGPATAERLEAAGLPVSVRAEEHIAEGLLAALPADLSGVPVLLPTARAIREVLPEALVARDAKVERLAVYETVRSESSAWQAGLAALRAFEVDALMLTSGSTAKHLLAILGAEKEGLLAKVIVAAIGPATARVAAEGGLRVDVMPSVYTIDGMLDALAARRREVR